MHVCTTGCIFRRRLQRRIPRETVGADSQGGIGEKTYRIYHPGGVRCGGREGRRVGRRYAQPPAISREWIFLHTVPCPPSHVSSQRRKMVLRLFDLFLRIHLDNSRTGNAARYFVSASVMNTDDGDDDDRDACLESADVSFIIRSSRAKSASRNADVSPRRLLSVVFAKAGRMHNWGDACSAID